MPRSSVLLFLALLATACASAPEPPPEPEIAGRYTFSTTVQGMPVDGQMRITGEPGAYDGSMYSEFTGELPFTSMTVAGSQATIVAETPDGPVEIRLTFEGDSFTGSWVLGPEGGSIRGRRVDT